MTPEYDVLRPIYWRTPFLAAESTPAKPVHLYRVQWLFLGTAIDMADAKARFGGSPVLRPITH